MRLVNDTCPHYPNGVQEGHHCDAPILLIGEAPGRTEDKLLRPFVGASGHLLDDIWEQVGIDRRRDVYITNVVPYRPANNDISTVPDGELEGGAARLKWKISNLLSPKVIVPTGNSALTALTGLYRIAKWRGSVIEYQGKWVLPTLHPAACLRQPILSKTLGYDWSKVRRLLDRGYERPQRELVVASTKDELAQAYDFLKPYANDKDCCLTFDIECTRDTHEILCVSFSAHPNWAFSLDTRTELGMGMVKDLLESPCQKGGQNLGFDCYVLRAAGIGVRRVWWDTSWLHHCLDPNAGPQDAEGKSLIRAYSLAYMASIFTDEPYWKDSAKDEGTGENYGKWKSNWRAFQEYNARDSAVTHELVLTLTDKLANLGRLDFYHNHYRKLFMPLMRISYHGMKFDLEAALRDGRRLQERLDALKQQIAGIAGQPLHTFKQYKRQPKKDIESCLTPEQSTSRYGIDAYIREGKSLSNPSILKWLRGAVPARAVPKSCDESALRSLKLKVPHNEQIHKLVDSILEYRGTEKTRQFLNTTRLDSDGRIRTSYSMLVQTGRLSSSKNPLGTGSNLQNIQRDVRHYFLPDEADWYILEIDLKQAEDKVVKVLSQSAEAITIARDNDCDVHTEAAARMFRVPEATVTKDQRYTGKRTRHARNYGMGAKRLQQILLNDGYVKSIGECEELLLRAGEAEPWVEDWHSMTRRLLWRKRSLCNSWGRAISFQGERVGDFEVIKRAYAFIPQSEVGDLLNQYGVISVDRFIRRSGLRARVNLQEHDALVVSVPREELYGVASFIVSSLTQPRIYRIRSSPFDPMDGGVELSIPADVTVSRHWKCGCGECKRHPVLEFDKGLGSEAEFYHKLEVWEGEVR